MKFTDSILKWCIPYFVGLIVSFAWIVSAKKNIRPEYLPDAV